MDRKTQGTRTTSTWTGPKLLGERTDVGMSIPKREDKREQEKRVTTSIVCQHV